MKLQDHLFTIWLTDDDWDGMPFLYEICIASAQIANNKPVTIYTNHKLHLSFLDRKITNIEMIPEELSNKAKEIDPNSKAHQSDYIRLWYLSLHGGIYFDTDILFWKPFDEIWNKLIESEKCILYPKEDKYMFTNCMIMCCDTDRAYPFFKNMFDEYETRFVKHSYLHNSQKMIDLMYRRYNTILEYTEPSLFEVTWNYTKSVQEFLNGKTLGIGQHLFSSNPEWNKFRAALNWHCYDLEPENFPTKLTKNIIDKYIDLMKEADKNDTN